MRFKMLALSPAAFLGRKVKLFGPRNMIKMMATCAWCPHPHWPYSHLPYPRTGTVHVYGGDAHGGMRQTGSEGTWMRALRILPK